MKPDLPPEEWPDYQVALQGMRSETHITSPLYRRQQWRAVREGAHPDILDFERLFVRRMFKLKIPVFAHNMVRTKDEQDALFVRGVTKSRGGESPHNHGCAVDLVHGIFAWDIPKAGWDLFGHIGKDLASSAGISIVWGGEWDFYDPAHWELTNWREYR